ncbi:MAG TPA: NAD-dependent epimerase/dehydratase family protein, partial [Streptosporangiaceae bacterium]
RLVFLSSVAAYGYHAGNPVPLTEDVPARGSPEHYYSAHKAACEALLAEATAGTTTRAYVLRPCIVAGPDATTLIRSLQWRPVTEKIPAPARWLLARAPGLRPFVPDPGMPVQLVHQDDVASAVLAAAVTGSGPPGAYNLAAAGQVTIADLARAAGDCTFPVPHLLAVAGSRLAGTLPWTPPEFEWIHAVRYPMLMDASRAYRDLGWVPRYTAHEALATMDPRNVARA